MSERTKRQHVVPRFYLRHFTQPDGELWTHDCVTGTARRSTPEKTAYETNIYTPTGEDGARIDLIEDTLAKIESQAAKIYLATSDNPVFWVKGGGAADPSGYGFGLGNPFAVIPFPLSPGLSFGLTGAAKDRGRSLALSVNARGSRTNTRRNTRKGCFSSGIAMADSVRSGQSTKLP